MAVAEKQSLTPAQWKSATDHLIELGQRMTQATSRTAEPANLKAASAPEPDNQQR